MNDPNQAPIPNAGTGAATIDIHTPFTPAERIQQLSEIDNDIASLLVHLSSAMRALATPPGSSVPQPSDPNPNPNSNSTSNPNDNDDDDDGDDDIDLLHSPSFPSQQSSPSDPLTTFKTAQSHFFRTVDRIDKHLTRQIFALEEAGIITLRGANSTSDQLQQQQQQQPQQQIEVTGAGGPAEGAKTRAAAAGGRIEPDGLGRYGTLDVGRLNVASSSVERDMEGEMWRQAREYLEGVVGRDGGEKMEE